MLYCQVWISKGSQAVKVFRTIGITVVDVCIEVWYLKLRCLCGRKFNLVSLIVHQTF